MPGWWQKIKSLTWLGIIIKICTLLGGVILIEILHFLWAGLVFPGFSTLIYVLGHIGEIFKK